jgi:hypothetical protein
MWNEKECADLDRRSMSTHLSTVRDLKRAHLTILSGRAACRDCATTRREELTAFGMNGVVGVSCRLCLRVRRQRQAMAQVRELARTRAGR